MTTISAGLEWSCKRSLFKAYLHHKIIHSTRLCTLIMGGGEDYSTQGSHRKHIMLKTILLVCFPISKANFNMSLHSVKGLDPFSIETRPSVYYLMFTHGNAISIEKPWYCTCPYRSHYGIMFHCYGSKSAPNTQMPSAVTAQTPA